MFNTFINIEKYKDEDCMSAWITNPHMTYEILKDDIIKFFETKSIPVYCFIIYPKCHSDKKDLSRILDRLDYFNSTKIIFVEYDIKGHFKYIDKELNFNEYLTDGEKEINRQITDGEIGEILKSIQQKIIIKLFNNNNAMMKFDHNYHFQTLSSKHTDKFIKISNLLIEKTDIDFLSICLLPHLDEKNVYIDTSTIMSLVQSTILLKKQLDNNYKIPTIFNFQSYDQYEKYFESTEGTNANVIISTTTTATIIKCIHEVNKHISTILVLFYYPVKDVDFEVKSLIELNKSMNISSPPKDYRADNCLLCKEGSIPVQIHSENFILATKEPNATKITINHKPKNLNSFFKNYVGSNILLVGGRKGASRFDFTVNDEELIKNRFFKDKLEYIIKRHFTYSIKQIICVDEDSISFAKLINRINRKLGADKIPYTLKNVFFDKNKHNKDDSVLILVGSISSGYALEEISRQLRETHPDSSRYYLIGMVKQFSEESFDFMKGNIDKNHMFQQSHLVLAIDKVLLPTNTEYTTWDKELDFLKTNFSNDFLDASNEFIKKRIAWLEETQKTATGHNIFWTNSENQELKLADGFAFWQFYNKTLKNRNNISQADVMFTFAVVLQYARIVKKDLAQTLYDSKIIAPQNFSRFNDGILQSSLLRLAVKQELDYSTTLQHSETITHMIKNIIKKHRSKQGEAAMEFLIALGTKHLKLHANSFESLIEFFTKLDVNDFPEHYKLIVLYLIHTIQPDFEYQN